MLIRSGVGQATLLLAAALVAAPHLLASEETKQQPAKVVGEPKEFVTHHTLEVEGRSLKYTAIAGETYLKDEDGTPKASIFSVSYLLEGVENPRQRPITFLFNGGPGSSSTWLHLGAFGPKRLDLGSDPLSTGSPPYPVRPNPDSLLDVTDLVFVDPVGTGYSKALGEGKDEDYWGVDEDAASVAQFVQTYLTDRKRWDSPKYLAGESYGTTRASLLVRDLGLKTLNGAALNGVILLSSALDFQPLLSGLPGNDLAYVADLPTYAATAYYHNALPDKPADLSGFLDEVRDFARGEYLTALFRGDTLSPEDTQAIAAKLHRYIGLSETYLRQSRLRVPARRFLKELLRDRGQTLAVHDTRFVGRDRDDAGESVDWDPFIAGIAGPFVTAINGYLADELEVDLGRNYVVYSQGAGRSWKRPKGDQSAFSGFLRTSSYLAEEAAANRDFGVFAAAGLYDLSTSYFGQEYTFEHCGLPSDRLTFKTYASGHMMYLPKASLAKLSSDVRTFIRDR